MFQLNYNPKMDYLPYKTLITYILENKECLTVEWVYDLLSIEEGESPTTLALWLSVEVHATQYHH